MWKKKDFKDIRQSGKWFSKS